MNLSQRPALDLGDDLEGMVSYDERLAASAEINGIRVVAPGRVTDRPECGSAER